MHFLLNCVNKYMPMLVSLSRSLNVNYVFQAGKRRAEKRHKFMEEFVKEFYDEWNGLS